MKKKYNFNLQQIEDTLKLKTWWATFAILPFARRIALFICNYSNIKPNAITFFSFIMRLISALLFSRGNHHFLIIGAVVFELAYIFDCVDGSVARLKRISSTTGAFFDHISDIFGISLNLAALAWGQGILFSPAVVLLISLYIFIHYMTFVANCIFTSEKCRIRKVRNNGKIIIDEHMFNNNFNSIITNVSKLVIKYRNFFKKRHFKSFFSPPDFEAVVCFIFPLLGNVKLGFHIGMYFLVVIFIYKLISYLYLIKIFANIENSRVC